MSLAELEVRRPGLGQVGPVRQLQRHRARLDAVQPDAERGHRRLAGEGVARAGLEAGRRVQGAGHRPISG
jgi:hypothetical protein